MNEQVRKNIKQYLKLKITNYFYMIIILIFILIIGIMNYLHLFLTKNYSCIFLSLN